MMSDYRIGKEFDIGLVGTEGSGEGFVRFGESFHRLPTLLQRDLLNDWIHDLKCYVDDIEATEDDSWKSLKEIIDERSTGDGE